jgi:hypothetical protein
LLNCVRAPPLKPGAPWPGKLPVGLLLVDPTCAEPHSPGEAAVPLDEDHSSICKPPSRDSDLYVGLLAFRRQCAGPARDAAQHQLTWR